MPKGIVLAEVDLVSDDVAVVAAALGVPLVEPALVRLDALTLHLGAIVQLERGGAARLIQVVDMVAT